MESQPRHRVGESSRPRDCAPQDRTRRPCSASFFQAPQDKLGGSDKGGMAPGQGETESGAPVTGWTCSASTPEGRACSATRCKDLQGFRHFGLGAGLFTEVVGQPEAADKPGVSGHFPGVAIVAVIS